jgi:hypothetical protein
MQIFDKTIIKWKILVYNKLNIPNKQREMRMIIKRKIRAPKLI